MKKQAVLTTCACILLVSCATFAPLPTPTPLPTSTPTSMPTRTATPQPTETPAPTATFSPTVTPDVLAKMIPTGEPAKSWKGIPIMPGAISGSGDDKGYTFTIQASSEEIQAYYDRELEKLGASRFAIGQGDSKDTIMLIYMMNGAPVSVSIIPQEDFVLVLIVK